MLEVQPCGVDAQLFLNLRLCVTDKIFYCLWLCVIKAAETYYFCDAVPETLPPFQPRSPLPPQRFTLCFWEKP